MASTPFISSPVLAPAALVPSNSSLLAAAVPPSTPNKPPSSPQRERYHPIQSSRFSLSDFPLPPSHPPPPRSLNRPSTAPRPQSIFPRQAVVTMSGKQTTLHPPNSRIQDEGEPFLDTPDYDSDSSQDTLRPARSAKIPRNTRAIAGQGLVGSGDSIGGSSGTENVQPIVFPRLSSSTTVKSTRSRKESNSSEITIIGPQATIATTSRQEELPLPVPAEGSKPTEALQPIIPLRLSSLPADDDGVKNSPPSLRTVRSIRFKETLRMPFRRPGTAAGEPSNTHQSSRPVSTPVPRPTTVAPAMRPISTPGPTRDMDLEPIVPQRISSLSSHVRIQRKVSKNAF